ncbi:hypothetical protein NFI96_018652 [Prochilodus magdalenae]|nr:hypothetical protein NFI96_018652 [Prochilodus magdalenae]
MDPVTHTPQAHERFEEPKLEAVRDNNVELVQDILKDLSPLANHSQTAHELACILKEPHFQSLLETHDSVASKSYETPPPSPCAFMDPAFNNQPVPPDAVRMVGIRKVSGEHLGVTFRVEGGELVIARILHGGMIDQQGLLHVGDVIKEVNGKEVGNDPKVLQDMLKEASGSVVLKILPSYQEPHTPRQKVDLLASGVYVRDVWSVFIPRLNNKDFSRDQVQPWFGGLYQEIWTIWVHHVTVTKDCSGVVPDCHGVTQNGSGSSSVTSPALVLVETPNESVCGGTVVSTKMSVGSNSLLYWKQQAPLNIAPTGQQQNTFPSTPKRNTCLMTRRAFVKCHFDYDPAHDNLIPCKEAGLRFSSGDILQIFNQEDPNWWQACHLEGGSAGLIPSQLLEEKRKAFVKRDLELTTAGPLCAGMGGKKKKKMMYLTTKNAEFDRHELRIYEEVAKVPPFRRKTLVLIGAQGVGRRSLKNKLLVSEPHRYGTTTPYTSRKPKVDEKEGQMYLFMSRSEMEADIKNGRFLEHGEYDGNLYGTKISSIHEVMDSGKICILDVNPQALKVLRTSEFLPYVVFIEAPDFEVLKDMNRSAIEAGVITKQLTDSELKRTVDESERIQRAYGHYFDLTIVNDNLDGAYRSLKGALERLSTDQQWVPVNWVF